MAGPFSSPPPPQAQGGSFGSSQRSMCAPAAARWAVLRSLSIRGKAPALCCVASAFGGRAVPGAVSSIEGFFPRSSRLLSLCPSRPGSKHAGR